jgi:hypothetical protein
MLDTTLTTGTYTIENLDRLNDIFLADDKSGTLVAGSSELDADPPLKVRNLAGLWTTFLRSFMM